MCIVPSAEHAAAFGPSITVFDFLQRIGTEAPDQQLICPFADNKPMELFTGIGDMCGARFSIRKAGEFLFECSCLNNQKSIPPTLIEIIEDSPDEIDGHILLECVQKIEQKLCIPQQEFQEVHVWVLNREQRFIVRWPINISHSQVATRLGYLLNMPETRCVAPWYEANFLIKNFDSRIIIVYNECLKDQKFYRC